MKNLPTLLESYSLDPASCTVKPFGDGLINATFLVNTGTQKYILQKINPSVFPNPEYIADNLSLAGKYLQEKHPRYLFLKPLETSDGKSFVVQEKEYWRLTDFLGNSFSINTVSTAEEAFEAAKAFATLTKNLHGASVNRFKPTISNFHSLTLRFQQLTDAIKRGKTERKKKAGQLIENYLSQSRIVETYHLLIANLKMPERIMHHDTKINNVLFDKITNKAVAVCDLDTLMPGRVISDIGDMFRTYLSPVSEESVAFDEISIRPEIYEAIVSGYLSELNAILTETEQQHLDYGGEFMIYMQGIRFLTDYLNGDVYYPIKHPEHNFDRALNQWVLLTEFQKFTASK